MTLEQIRREYARSLEVDPELAARAKQNLAPWPHARVEQSDAMRQPQRRHVHRKREPNAHAPIPQRASQFAPECSERRAARDSHMSAAVSGRVVHT